jgi:hypothetical protein
MVLTVLPPRLSVLPLQTGLLEDTKGVAGVESMTTIVLDAGEVQPAMVNVTL